MEIHTDTGNGLGLVVDLFAEEVELAQDEDGHDRGSEQGDLDEILIVSYLVFQLFHLFGSGAIGSGNWFIHVYLFIFRAPREAETPLPVLLKVLDRCEGKRQNSGYAACCGNHEGSVEAESVWLGNYIQIAGSASTHWREGPQFFTACETAVRLGLQELTGTDAIGEWVTRIIT